MTYKHFDASPGFSKLADSKRKTLDGGGLWQAPSSDRLALDARPDWSAPEMGLPLSSLPVGTPGNDTLIKFLTFLGAPIVWRVIGANLPNMPKNSITLYMDKIVALRCFDAAEPNNSDNYRKTYGNNDWGVSNLRQWANSSASAGRWYSAQHSADAPPDTERHSGGSNTYQADRGFLAESTAQERDLLLATTRNYGEYSSNGKSCTDKVFTLTTNELGLQNIANNGTKIPYFTDDNSRITQCTAQCIADSDYDYNPGSTSTDWDYWTATSVPSYSYAVRRVTLEGMLGSGDAAYYGQFGVRLACNIPATAHVSPEPDEDGCYVILT